jgi:hypothetical protein
MFLNITLIFASKNILFFTILLLNFSGVLAQLKICQHRFGGIKGVFNLTQTREKGSPENLLAGEYFMEDLAAVIQELCDLIFFPGKNIYPICNS